MEIARPAIGPERRALGRRVAAAPFALGLLVVLWGGYARGWRWTGFERSTTLWDWLQLLMLPLAFTLVPLWIRHRTRLRRTHHAGFLSAAAAFGLLVVLGYTMHLSWTGFPGNRLWDWLELLLLPLAVALLPVWTELADQVRPRHVAIGAAAVLALVVCAVGGYDYGWRWTGFQGNTLFDWIRLLIAPLLLPVLLVPLAAGWFALAAGLADDERQPKPAAGAAESEG